MKKPRAKVIAVVGLKGGSGRSTLATNLAGELAKIGRTVLVDADPPQGTAASWAALRREAGPDEHQPAELAVEQVTTHGELIARYEHHAPTCDFLLVDGPPRIAGMTHAALMLSDIALIPVGASLAELWATTDLLAIVDEARKERTIDARIVWTRHRPYTTLARELTDQTRDTLPLPALKSTLGLRVAYVDALGTGRTVAETGDAVARDELTRLLREVRRILG